MRTYLVASLLLGIRMLSRLCLRYDARWVGTPTARPWDGIRVIALLNHTSLFEPVLAGAAPTRLLWQVARHGVLPVAKKTAGRPLVGRFYRLVAREVISITRERDRTWANVLWRANDPEALVVIAPEGRMKRTTGLDVAGARMTIRGGIADILRGIPSGGLLLVYSGGLHHIQAPGQVLPRPFRRVRLKLERLEIADYRRELLQRAGEAGFKRAVIEDLTRRRDRYCS
ncbi:MAG: 1-acyl-sn-glycerol-3-phosphate acyltransferase [Gemmatimonadota bacterium]